MARVVGQLIPAELLTDYQASLDEATPSGTLRTKKKRHRFRETEINRVTTGLFREGSRMYSAMQNHERQVWRDAGAAQGMNGRAFFLMFFLNTCLSRGKVEIGTFTVGSWMQGDTQYVGAANRVFAELPLVKINHWFCVGFSHVGLTGRIP